MIKLADSDPGSPLRLNFRFVAVVAMVLLGLIFRAERVVASGCVLQWLSDEFDGQSGFLTQSPNSNLNAAFQQEGLQLIAVFNVAPSGLFFVDGSNPNAFATPEVMSANGPDGTVVLGLSLASQELARDLGYGFSIPAIMAHEFGHILQFKRGGVTPGKNAELQADYLAGW